jgi:hypothetical protein
MEKGCNGREGGQEHRTSDVQRVRTEPFVRCSVFDVGCWMLDVGRSTPTASPAMYPLTISISAMESPVPITVPLNPPDSCHLPKTELSPKFRYGGDPCLTCESVQRQNAVMHTVGLLLNAERAVIGGRMRTRNSHEHCRYDSWRCGVRPANASCISSASIVAAAMSHYRSI